ncbi:MAG TPA: hypothetical protein VMF10_15080 [Candidatus Aquilonibacter sp.]|nr:hypothetical protein [Candidatus Aquilonibacter sp.]
MALPAKQERYPDQTNILEVVPPASQACAALDRQLESEKFEFNEMPHNGSDGLRHVSGSTAKVAALLGKAEGCLELAWHEVSDRADRFSRGVQHRVGRMRNENPFQAIALIAATAFVAGVVLRIWRSQRNG